MHHFPAVFFVDEETQVELQDDDTEAPNVTILVGYFHRFELDVIILDILGLSESWSGNNRFD